MRILELVNIILWVINLRFFSGQDQTLQNKFMTVKITAKASIDQNSKIGRRQLIEFVTHRLFIQNWSKSTSFQVKSEQNCWFRSIWSNKELDKNWHSKVKLRESQFWLSVMIFFYF